MCARTPVLPPSFPRSGVAALMNAWRQEMSQFELTAATLGGFGVILRRALHLAPGALGNLSRQVDISQFLPLGSSEKAEPVVGDLFPLPFKNLSAEDMVALYAPGSLGANSRCGPFWGPTVSDHKVRLKQVRAWVWNMVVTLNFMARGFAEKHEDFKELDGEPSGSQILCIRRLYIAADEFLGENKEHLPSKNWDEVLGSRRLTYRGEIVATAQELTLEQVLPALPPALRLVSFCLIRHYRLSPGLSGRRPLGKHICLLNLRSGSYLGRSWLKEGFAHLFRPVS